MASGTGERKGERTRQSLVARAIRRFALDGYKGVTLTDVARDVGISPAAVYAYFPGKEALFTAAVDADAAGLIDLALTEITDQHFRLDWAGLIGRLLGALPDHPLARRVLAGLEPETIGRLISIPALTELREGLGRLLAEGQQDGDVRSDIDPVVVADGLVTLVLALLIATLQTGGPAEGRAGGVMAVLDAALQGPGQPGHPGGSGGPGPTA
jgi:AcrR family transcriptional regulator